MKKILFFLCGDERHASFHTLCVGGVAFGLFIAFTAGELGPFAPLLISQGLYLTMFGLFLEAIFWLRKLGQRLSKRQE